MPKLMQAQLVTASQTMQMLWIEQFSWHRPPVAAAWYSCPEARIGSVDPSTSPVVSLSLALQGSS